MNRTGYATSRNARKEKDQGWDADPPLVLHC